MSNKKTTIEMLKECVKELEAMSQEKFDAIIKEKGIENIVYNEDKYTNDVFHIILGSEMNNYIIKELEAKFTDCKFVINRLDKGTYCETTINYNNKKYLTDCNFLDIVLEILKKYYSEDDLFRVATTYDLLHEYF